MIGEQETWIGSYRLIKELGRGGMGVVYLAYDKNVNREVAIKVIVEKSREGLARFGREAQSIANLEHPNIIKLYDFFYMKNTPFMVMEYVAGDELECYIAKHKLSMVDSVKLIIPIINAVFYAHSKGVIHRDIKPSNILVDAKGKPFLMDFGLAKANEVTDKSLTRTGVAMGSPGYMSPEQAQGKKKLGFETDIYSLGATLYKVITGVPPVEGDSMMEFLYKLTYDKVVPPRQKKPTIPKDLEIVCLKALEKKKEDRYQNAKLFAVDLMNSITGKRIRAKKKWSRISLWIAMIVFFASLGIYKYYYDKSIAQQEKRDAKAKLEEMENNAEMVVHHWIRNGFYEKAEAGLRDAFNGKKIVLNKYNFYMALIKGRQGKDKEFNKYSNLIESKSKDEIRDLHITKYYLDGVLYYRKGQFKKALENFVALEKMGEFLSDSDKLFYYIGKCLLKKEEYLKGKEYLEKANLGDWGEIYNSLGDAYFGLSNYDEAEKNYRKYLESEGENSDVYVKLSRSLLNQGKVAEAGEILEEISRLDIANLEISKSFIELAMRDSNLLEKHYFGVLNSLDQIEYKEESVFDFYLRKVIEENEQYYILKNTLEKQENADLDKLLERLNDNNVYAMAKSGLLSARYQERFEEIKVDFLDEHQKKIYTDILYLKKEEKEKINYYIIAKGLLYPKLGILEEISVVDLLKILRDETRSVLYRYLAASALVIKYEWRGLMDMTKSDDVTLKIICISALEDADIYLDYRTYPDMKIIGDRIQEYTSKDKFLHLLIIRHYKVLGLEKSLGFLLKNADLSFLLGIRKGDLIDIGLNVGSTYLADLEKFFGDNEKTFLHDLAESRYWGVLPISEKEKWHKFWGIFAQHSLVVKKTVLERGIKEEDFVVSPEIIKRIVVDEENSYLKIMAVKNAAMKKNLDLLLELFNKSTDELLKVYIFFRAVIANFLKFGRILDNKLLNENSAFLRSYGYAFYTIFNGEVLELLEKERNNVYLQANIMRFSSLPNPIPFLSASKWSNKKRKEILGKYLYTEGILQKESWISYVYFSEYSEIMQICESSIHNENPIIRVSIAEGLRHQLRDLIELGQNESWNFGLFKDASYFIEQYMGMGEVKSLNVFRKHIQDIDKKKEYRDKAERIVSLNNQDVLGLVWLGLLEREDGNYSEALKQLEKANQLERKLLYCVELADIYWEKEGYVPTKVLDEIILLVKNKDVPPLILKPLVKMHTIDFVEKILMANRLSFIQLRSSKKKDKEMLDESDHNLLMYYKERGKGEEQVFYRGK